MTGLFRRHPRIEMLEDDLCDFNLLPECIDIIEKRGNILFFLSNKTLELLLFLIILFLPRKRLFRLVDSSEQCFEGISKLNSKFSIFIY